MPSNYGSVPKTLRLYPSKKESDLDGQIVRGIFVTDANNLKTRKTAERWANKDDPKEDLVLPDFLEHIPIVGG